MNIFQISNIKLALARKETELEQWKNGNARNAIESQKPRAVSPYRLPKYGTGGSMKPDNSQRSMDDRSSEVIECTHTIYLAIMVQCSVICCLSKSEFYFQAANSSSGKQRRSRLPSTFMDKDSMPKSSLLAEEKLVSSAGKGRSPSPPIRRSISTDRGSVIKSKVKSDTIDNQPILKHTFPARVNKSLAIVPMALSTDNNSKVYVHSQEHMKQDNISETLFNLQKVSSRKIHQEHEEEQFKQALSAVKQGVIRKSKAESKAKAKHHQQLPFRIQKPEVPTLISDMETPLEVTVDASRKSDYSEPENDLSFMESAVHGVLNPKNIRHNISRNSQNIGSRYG